MYLKSLHIENWRAIKTLDVSFEPGLNVVQGPNESGKSSLREALRCAFVYPSRPRGKTDVSSARPWGTKEKPLVQVRFFHQDAEWVVRKVFFTDESELQRDGRMLAQGTSVQNELTKILATDGLSALWSVQGDPDSPGVPGDLRGSFAESEAITPGSHWLIDQVEDRFGNFWTAKTQRPRQPLSEVRDTTHAAERQVDQLEDKLYEANELSRQADAQDDELLSLKQRHQDASERFRQQKEKLREEIAGLEQKIERAFDWEKKWKACCARVEQEHQKQLAHEARVAEQKELLGEQPSRDELESFRHKETYLAWLAQQKIESELTALGETDHALKRLEEIESQHQQVRALLDLLDQTTEESEGNDDKPSLSQREKQMSDMEAKLEKLSRDLESWSEAGRQKERIERSLADLGTLVENWGQVRDALNSAWADLQTHKESLQALKDKVGPEPDREEIEVLQRQQSYLQFALHRKILEELEALKGPNSDALSEMVSTQQKLQTLEERSNEAPTANPVATSSHLPKILSLAAGVALIGFGYAANQDMETSKSFGLAVLLFAVAVVFGYFFFGSTSGPTKSESESPKERAEELKQKLAALLAEHGCETVEQAQTTAERRKVLQTQMYATPSGNPEALADSEEGKTLIDGLTPEQLRAEIKATPDKLEEAEKDWKKRHAAHAGARTAYEALLKDSPKSRVETLLQQMAQWAKHERLAGFQVPKTCHQEWIEQLKTESPLQAIQEEMTRSREALEKIDHPGEEKVDEAKSTAESLKAELKARKESLDEIKAKAQATQGANEARLAQILRLIEKTPYLQEELVQDEELSLASVPALREQAASLQSDLEEQSKTLLREADVESKEQLEARDEERRSLKPLLNEDLSAPENLTDIVAAVDPDGQLEALSRLQINQRLANLDKERESAEDAWKERNQTYAKQREQFEALLKEDPSGTLTSTYQQLKELGEDPEAAKVDLPDEFDARILEDSTSPGDRWQTLQASREEQVKEFRLLLRSPEQAPADHPLRTTHEKLREAEQELELRSGQLNQNVGTMSAHEELYAELCRAQEELRDAQRKQRQVEMEANGLAFLRNALTETQAMLEDKLVAPLRDRISERIDKLTSGAYQDIRISADFTPQELLTPDEQGAPVGELSFGTREQVAFLSRLCLADLLSESERHVVVFDDSLVHTDDERMKVACEILKEAAESSQVIIMTCHPERIESLLEEAHVIDLSVGSRTVTA